MDVNFAVFFPQKSVHFLPWAPHKSESLRQRDFLSQIILHKREDEPLLILAAVKDVTKIWKV